MKKEKIVFGIISDTHLGSIYDRIDLLNDFYKILKSEKIKKVYHAGDFTDGFKIYNGQEFETKVQGLENLVEYAVKYFPKKKDIETYFILGNHDTKYFYWKVNVDIGKRIAQERDDLIPIYSPEAPCYARVFLGKNKKIAMDLIHPIGGHYYSKSYGGQKYFREQKKNVPHIAVFGHRHQKMNYRTREIEVFEAGCFLDADKSNYYKRKGFLADLGGWIIEIDIVKNKIKKINSTFISYN